ncbi:MAG TPA: NBR1-Ig-like domain-containing protein [Pseudonocardiaceae bacterium]|jgi:transcriptional regulator with XRE-family HTH domain|nr:NBR1-Ig-like domain-containing protein [Pseudonocardiaceae bacterium]
MRELRQSTGISLRRTAELSGWNKSHLSRVECGSTKPSLPLIEWYDGQFGAGNTLIVRFRELADSGPIDQVTGTPNDHDPRDACALVAETVPDGTLVRPGALVRKTWTLRNTGPVNWRGRWLSRLGMPERASWLRCPTRVPVPDIGPGGEALIELDVTTPHRPGACVAYFTLTDLDGRPYLPESLRCSLYVAG